MTVSLASFAFSANDVSAGAIHFGMAFPQIFNLKPSTENADSESYSAWGFNFGGRMVVGLPFGFYADGTLYFPYSYKIKEDNTTTKYSLNDSNTSFWGIGGQLGIYSVAVNSGRFLLPFGAGLHLNYLSATYDKTSTIEYSQSAFSLGIGAWTNAEFTLTDKITLYGGLRLDFDFFDFVSYDETVKTGSVSKVTSTSDSSIVSKLFLTPVFGAIIRF